MSKLDDLLTERANLNEKLSDLGTKINKEIKPYILSVLKLFKEEYPQGASLTDIIHQLVYIYDERIWKEEVNQGINELVNIDKIVALENGVYELINPNAVTILKKEMKI